MNEGVENASLKGRSLGAFTRQPKNRNQLVLKTEREDGNEVQPIKERSGGLKSALPDFPPEIEDFLLAPE